MNDFMMLSVLISNDCQPRLFRRYVTLVVRRCSFRLNRLRKYRACKYVPSRLTDAP